MTNLPATTTATGHAIEAFTSEELRLIRDTVAPTATPKEFELFVYRCRLMGLNPLKPGLVHFVKYGNSPGTMIVGIDGFRARAESTGQHDGTERGVLRDEKGKCIGAWAVVYRKDRSKPFRDEVSLSEYSTGKAMWAKMPETMIKKVAECAVLRMAFPDQLAGVYAPEEMDQAAERPPASPAEAFTGHRSAREEVANSGAMTDLPAAPLPLDTPEDIAAIEAGFASLQEAKDMRRYAFRTAIKNGWSEKGIKDAVAAEFQGRGFRGLTKDELLQATMLCERRPPKGRKPEKPANGAGGPPQFADDPGGVPPEA